MTCTQFYAFIKKQIGKGGATFRKFCGMTAGAWCCAYVTWNFHKTGNKALFYGGKKVVYCPTAIKWCMAFLAQIPMYLAMPGDIIFFDWNKNKVPDHIGHVKKHKSNSSILTHEGNTNGGIVAEKERPAKYVLGVFRPHFKPPKDVGKKKLELDGDCGYYTVWNLEIALGLKPTGILSKAVVKVLQRKAGATPDGAWLVKTSKAVQRMTGAKPDGDFFAVSVKHLQGWVNKVNGYGETRPKTSATTPAKPKKTPKPHPLAVKAVEWALKIAKSKKYGYKKWTKKANTHKCPICHPKSGMGWNCIGFISAAWHHGAGLKNIKCACNGIGTDGFFDKVTLESWVKRNGKGWKLITNGEGKGGKDIPYSSLIMGDIVVCYDGDGNFHHIAMITRPGYYIDCTNTSEDHIAERPYTKLCGKYHVTRAFRYTGA